MDGFDYDVVVIGSGFGGSVMTCRLTEKGYRVCLLERGRRYGYGEFPRHTHEAKGLFWDPDDNLDGLYEANLFAKSDAYIVCASGLGGGSLVYANVLMKMDEDFFGTWPGGITLSRLDPFYRKALDMLEASPYPFGKDPYYTDTPKSKIMADAIASMTSVSGDIVPPSLLYPDLAVRFKGNFPGEQSLNNQGVVQSRCNKCGECDVGCNIHAKNTLDLNYLARATNKSLLPSGCVPAEVRTSALVEDIVPLDGTGYRVSYKDLDSSELIGVTAGKVVLSAGSYGSTTLLLKLKARGRLPRLSGMLGRNWCGNGDVEATILDNPKEVLPTVGPVITTAIKFRSAPYPDGFPHGMYIQDGGFPSHVAWYFIGKMPSPGATLRFVRFAVKAIKKLLGMDYEVDIGDDVLTLMDDDKVVRRAMIMLGMGRDRSTGRLYINEKGDVELEWKMDGGSQYHFDRLKDALARFAKSLGGELMLNPMTYFDKVIAVHPLGGAVMADSSDKGVVDTMGEAFGHPGLYVVDGSILPSSTCANPSLTIAAVAEMIADGFNISQELALDR